MSDTSITVIYHGMSLTVLYIWAVSIIGGGIWKGILREHQCQPSTSD